MNELKGFYQTRLMGYNLIAFTGIFTVFSLILYAQISNTLYSPVEKSMHTSVTMLMESDDFVLRQLSIQRSDPTDSPRDKIFTNKGPHNLPMRIQAVIRDQSGTILNTHALGRLYFDNYLSDLPQPTPDSYNKTVTFTLGDSTYRSLSFVKKMTNGDVYYIQILSNIDGEKSIVDHFLQVLIICTIVFILLSITASYLLSRKSMKPIISSWKRQTEFVENASHELRTPLTIVQNKLESMLTKPDATIMEKAEEIGVALSETRRLAKLTADLMTLARADSGEVQLEKEPIFIDELITQVCQPYQELAQMQEKSLQLELGASFEIHADKSRIHQLMVILLDNALKYTSEGNFIYVRTERKDNQILIEVADTGIGIADESKNRIFDRFYREDKARSRGTGGSGLGLSIAKWIVDSHEGVLSVHENEGGGTLFRIKLKA